MPDNDRFDLQEFLPYLLNQAAEMSSLEFQQVYKDRYGMLRTEWRVLFHLGLYGRMTAGEIGHSAKMHKTKISRAVHRLAERRFLARTRDAADRRVEHLDLTAQGRKAYAELREIAMEYDAALVAKIGRDQAEILRQTLRVLAELPPKD
ncbi:MarR family winged helix-turn-helix transcriptional regulator [uncultured Roseobacter sp.]|uniref:MarR family winged helix-turn-helix transcriptional regulator n=1 Tax=uncultured Roseobacter sp. TaxID=114847 RepID=UPI002626C5CE|nr:MarR family transcriptional regulator [uncultured Roseobacter sp.]